MYTGKTNDVLSGIYTFPADNNEKRKHNPHQNIGSEVNLYRVIVISCLSSRPSAKVGSC